MTQSSENICENLDVDKKDLNGKVISDKNEFSFDPSKDYGFNETSHNVQVFSRDNLIAQHQDSEIYSLFNKALSDDGTLPKGFRIEVLSLANENPLSGRLGVIKTY